MTWISVRDRLPIDAGYYLVWCGDKDDPEDKCVRYDDFYNIGAQWGLADHEGLEITHWMELPEGPKDDR